MVTKRATRYQAKGLAMWAAALNTASLPLPVLLRTRAIYFLASMGCRMPRCFAGLEFEGLFNQALIDWACPTNVAKSAVVSGITPKMRPAAVCKSHDSVISVIPLLRNTQSVVGPSFCFRAVT